MLALVCFCSCGGEKKYSTPPQEELRMSLSKEDTTIVTGLVSEFMDRVVSRDKNAAAAMLYTVYFDDNDGQPFPLNDQQIANLDQMLSMPVTGYEIAGYVFDKPDRNEVRCRVRINGRIVTNWYFKPVRYLGSWYLCIKDSSQGDQSFDNRPSEVAL